MLYLCISDHVLSFKFSSVNKAVNWRQTATLVVFSRDSPAAVSNFLSPELNGGDPDGQLDHGNHSYSTDHILKYQKEQGLVLTPIHIVPMICGSLECETTALLLLARRCLPLVVVVVVVVV